MEELREESASRRSGRVRRPPDPPGSRPMTVNMQVDGAADAADEDAPELEENGDDNDDDNDDEAAEGDDDDDGDEEDNQPNDSRASSRTIRSPTPEDHEPRPWLDWSDHQRHQLELTFTIQTDTLINHSVATTEAYIAHRDEEMLRYLRDFPCSQWMVGQEAARAAYDAMLSRADLRARGQSIVTSRGIPRWWPLGPTPRAPTAVVRPMPPLPPPRPATQAMPLRGSNSPYVSPFPPINQHFAGLPPHMRPFGAQSPMTATPMHAPSPPAVYHQPMGHVPTVGVPLPYPGMQAPFRAADAQTYKRSVQQRLQQQSQQQPRQQPQPNPPSRQASTPQSRFPPPMQLPQSTAPEPRGRPTRQKRLSSQPTIPTSRYANLYLFLLFDHTLIILVQTRLLHLQLLLRQQRELSHHHLIPGVSFQLLLLLASPLEEDMVVAQRLGSAPPMQCSPGTATGRQRIHRAGTMISIPRSASRLWTPCARVTASR